MKKVLLILSLLMPFWAVGTAGAHVALRSDTGGSSAVLHVTPDDDPIAGSETEFYFDISSDNLNTSEFTFKLSITDADGQVDSASLTPVGVSGVLAKYTFARRGAYEINLTATPTWASRDKPIESFSFTQRVSRGVVGEDSRADGRGWAEAGLIGSISTLLVIIVLIINRRGIIAEFTRGEAGRRPK